MTHRRAVLILLGCTFVWGASFTFNKMALAGLSPLLFMAVRFAVSMTLVSPVYRRATREDWLVGLPLGALFGIQLALFVVGLARIDPARSAFLFSFQTPLVPVLMLVAHRQAPSGRDLTAVALAIAGAWWLTQTGGGTTTGFGIGDLATIGSAACAALYVVVAGQVAPRHDPMRLLAVQFVAMTVLAGVGAILLERPRFEPSLTILLLVPFLAVSSIATFGGQLLGQRLIRPTEAALLYAIEPLVAAGVSYLTLGERLTGAQWLGGALIVAASFVAQAKKSPEIPAPVGPGP
jgi:drug/metabolite transporter (DMT)-like permease